MALPLYPLKLYLTKKPNLVMFSLSLAMNIGIWLWLLLQIHPQKEPVFLHYTILFGVDLTGDWYRVLAVPVVGLCIFFVNAFLGWVLFQKDSFVAYILNAMSVVCHLFLGIVAALLVLLNV